MKRLVILLVLTMTPLLTGAMARLHMFNGLIGQGVKAHCERSAEEKADDLRIVNAHTGPYKVVIVCEPPPALDQISEDVTAEKTEI